MSSRLFHTVVGNAVIVVELEPDVRTTSLLFVTPLGDEGFALMDYLSTISLSRLGEKVGEITDPDARKRLRAAVRAAFSFADGE
ncbi:hypothetical protein ACFY05_32390 [Microtetraspora fusca]|uniref:Type II toxin-antitoxin system PemK/MazF family toxin n=1 Tax=Microtetraspora fusca TaxID=1997 RepID=A0ABW6VE33_MICFU